jgi:hypothetical protein
MRLKAILFPMIFNISLAAILLIFSVITITALSAMIIVVSSIISILIYKIIIDTLLTISIDNNLSTQDMLLNIGACPHNTRYIDGKTRIHLAAERNQKDLITNLIKYGADVNDKDNNGMTPLQLAAYAGHKETVLMLIEKGTRLKNFDWGKSPLDLAVTIRHYDLAITLISKYVPGCSRNILIAARDGNTKLVNALIHAGTDINIQDDLDETPLHQAIENSKTETALTILRNGADINIKNERGYTPFELATRLYRFYDPSRTDIRDKQIDIALALIEKVTDIETKNNYLKIASKMGGIQELVITLIDKGANIDNKTLDYCSSLTMTALIEKGYDMNKFNPNQIKEYKDNFSKNKQELTKMRNKITMKKFGINNNIEESYLKSYIVTHGLKKIPEKKIIQNILEYAGIAPLGLIKFSIAPSPARELRTLYQQRNISSMHQHEFDKKFGITVV